MAALDIGYKPGVGPVLQDGPKVVYLLGADSGVVSRDQLPKDAVVIYQGMLYSLCLVGELYFGTDWSLWVGSTVVACVAFHRVGDVSGDLTSIKKAGNLLLLWRCRLRVSLF